MTELLLAAAAGLAIALLLGWALWARPLSGLRAERDEARKAAEEAAAEVSRQREERGKHATEVVMLTKRNEELARAEGERERLAGELRAIRAAQEERDRAHQAELVRLNETFQSLAGKALEAAQAQFLQRADARFAEHQTLSETKVKSLLAPVAETLVRYESELKKVEAARTEAYGGLKQQIEAVMLGQEKVSGDAGEAGNRAALVGQGRRALGRGTVPQRAGRPGSWRASISRRNGRRRRRQAAARISRSTCPAAACWSSTSNARSTPSLGRRGR